MIDWGSLAANSFWILGCALALAATSYASWQAALSGIKLGVQLKQPQLRASLDLAGLLFCTGLLLTADSRLTMIVWAVLGVFFFLQLLSIARTTADKNLPKE